MTGKRKWTYDAKDQLTSEISTQYTSWNHGNTFDAAGNPTTFKNNSRTYNANNQLVTPGTNVYDGNGNPTTYNGTSVIYDVENRVTSYGSVQTNGYRADGLRAWKETSAGRTYFLYDSSNPIIEMDSSGNTTNLNVFAPDGLIARKEGSTWTYYTFDAQGNVVHKLNSSNQPTAARLLDAWGQGVETTLPRNIDPWGYNAKWGYYYDRETSLYYCQNRMYDASTGRWLNRDPIGAAGGINLYGYCENGAVGSADPEGLHMLRLPANQWRIPNSGFRNGRANDQVIVIPTARQMRQFNENWNFRDRGRWGEDVAARALERVFPGYRQAPRAYRDRQGRIRFYDGECDLAPIVARDGPLVPLLRPYTWLYTEVKTGPGARYTTRQMRIDQYPNPGILILPVRVEITSPAALAENGIQVGPVITSW